MSSRFVVPTLVALLSLVPATGSGDAGDRVGPPRVALSQRIAPETRREIVTVQATITHPLGVRGYRIYQNDELKVDRDVPPARTISLSHDLGLHEGPTVIEIVPVDHAGDLASTRRVLTVRYQRPPPRLWALVVGVGAHRQPGIPPCRFCVDDAQAFAAALARRGLVCACGDEFAFSGHADDGAATPHIRRLLGAEATGARIRSALEEIGRLAGRDDTVVFYFAGTGASTARGTGLGDVVHHLLPYDVEPGRVAVSTISIPSLAQLLTRIRGDVYAYLDTSFAWSEGPPRPRSAHLHAGLTAAQRASLGAKLAANRWLEELAPNERIRVLAAGRGVDGAEESARHRHGLFTRRLLEALNGEGDVNRDGQVTFEETFAYVLGMVKADTAGRQVPVRLSSASRDPLALTPLPRRSRARVSLDDVAAGAIAASTIRGRIDASRGIVAYHVEVNDVPVVRRKLSRERSREFAERIFPAGYGNRVTMVVRDGQALFTRASVFLANYPALPMTPVALERFSADGAAPDGSRVSAARHDVQKLLDDLERLAKKRLVEEDRHRSVREFWREVLAELDRCLAAGPEERARRWAGVRARLAERVGITLPDLAQLEKLWTDEEEIAVSADVAAADVVGASSRYQLAVNGVPVLAEHFSGRRTFRAPVPLTEGLNRIEASVESPLGIVAAVPVVVGYHLRDYQRLRCPQCHGPSGERFRPLEEDSP